MLTFVWITAISVSLLRPGEHTDPSPFALSRPPPNPACSLRFARTVTLSGGGAWRALSAKLD
jgi:hypothetical protein